MKMSSLYNTRSENNDHSSIVTIDLSNHPPNSKLGMLLAPGSLPAPIISSSDGTSSSSAAADVTASNVTLVAGWEHGNNQQLGPIQRSGMVRLGDRLVRINGKDVTDWTFREVMDVLKEMIISTNTTATRKRRLTTLGFAPAGTEEWSRGVFLATTAEGEEFNSTSMLFGLFQSQESKLSPHVISKRLYSFVSYIGRWRVVVVEEESTTATATATAGKVSGSSNNNGASLPTKGTTRESLQQEEGQQQQRQISENSTDLLEDQLHKEPSMKFDRDGPIDTPEEGEEEEEEHDDTSQNNQATTTKEQATPSIFSPEAEAEWHKQITDFQEKKNSPPKKKKIVQYEIICHLLLRDPNSFKSNSHGNKHNNLHHHSWSVWKRYSEFQSLDAELRHVFGWQMDATDDGKGIVFPSVHGLESWWYGWRNGGGYFTKLMGGSYGVNVEDDARVEEEDNNKKEEEDASISSTTCPYPKPFIEKRQKELGAYWISITKVEDIFEFSDVNSHRFSALMASFLGVDEVLLSKRTSSSRAAASSASATSSLLHRYHQPTSPSRLTVPVIHENETELFSFGARKSELHLSPITPTPSRELSGITFNDDDVSMLSDGTGANNYFSNLQNNSSSSPVPAKRLLVENVPAQFTSNNPPPLTSGDRSVSSRSTKRVGGGRGSSRMKPAFQRQFMD